MSKADALLPVLKSDLNSMTASRQGVLSAPCAHMCAACQQLTPVCPSSADGCFLIASGSGANGARSISWVFFTVVEKERAGGAVAAYDDTMQLTGLCDRARVRDHRFFRGGSSTPTRSASPLDRSAVAAPGWLRVRSPVCLCCVSGSCDPCALTSTDREPLQGSEHCLHLSLPSCCAALRTAGLCDSLR